MKKTILLAIACIFCGCSAHSRDKDALYIHLAAEPDSLNSILSNDANQSRVNAYIYEPLLERDRDTLQYKPALAERWEISPDGLTYTFYLRHDVYWHDGVKLTSEDVLFSYKTIMDPKVACAHYKIYFADVASVSAQNEYTVKFTFRKKYFKALETCASISIIPKHIAIKESDFNSSSLNRSPVGNGPYSFSRWNSGRKIVLTRNENYHGIKPTIRKIVFKVIPEPNVALQLLKKGELDMMNLRPIQWARQTNSDKFAASFYKLKFYQPNYSYIAWNGKKPFFKTPALRIAMTMMINRTQLAEKLMFGLSMETTGPFYMNGPDYDKSIQPYPYSPQKASQILASEGWRDSDADGILDKDGRKFSFTFIYPSQSKFSERLSTILKEDFAKAGIEVKISKLEWSTFLKRVEERNYDSMIMAWSMPFESDLYQLWHSSQSESGSNYVSYRNPEIDMLIEKCRGETDYKKRVEVYRKIHRIIHEDQPYTFMFCNPELYAVSKKFSNVKTHISGIDTNEWSIEK